MGYETRIEAAIRAFRNHHRPTPSARLVRTPKKWEGNGKVEVSKKTLLFPNWDPLSLQLIVASLKKHGLDARLLEETEGSIRRSLRHNTGPCTPLNIIVQDFVEYVGRHDLDPSKCVLWVGASKMACNIGLYPHHIQSLLRAHGRGFERSTVYPGAMSLGDLSPVLPFDAYLAYMFGGFMRRLGCKIRPYERHRGETDRILDDAMGRLVEAFQTERSKEEALAQVVARFEAIERAETPARPKVAVFGDLYARDNDVLNQDILHFVEAHGGEVLTTPYTSYVKMVARPYYWKWFVEGHYLSLLSATALLTTCSRLEKKYYRYFARVLDEPQPAYDTSPQRILSQYKVRVEHTG